MDIHAVEILVIQEKSESAFPSSRRKEAGEKTMLKEFLRRYFAVPLIYRVGAAFVVGVLAGIVISRMGELYGPQTVEKTVAWIAPFGNALIAMLKMIVIPIIFFSLVSGAASLPIRKFGNSGSSMAKPASASPTIWRKNWASPAS